MKQNVLKIIIGSVFIVVFNLLFFLLGGTDRTATEWICYGFIHAAYLCLLCTPLLYKSRKGEAVLVGSLYLRALFYFFIELIAGLAFMRYNAPSPLWPAIVQGAMLTVFLILQLMSVLANDATHASLEKQKNERVYIRSLAENVKDAMRKVSDTDLHKQMNICYQKLNNSSFESFPEAKNAEIELENAVNTLCSMVSQGQLDLLNQQIECVLSAIQKRNRVIKMARYS